MNAHEMSVLAAIPALKVATAPVDITQQPPNICAESAANSNNQSNNKLLAHHLNCGSDVNSNYSYLDCNLKKNGNNIRAQQCYQNLHLNYQQHVASLGASFATDNNNTLNVNNFESLILSRDLAKVEGSHIHRHSDNNNNTNGNNISLSNTDTNSSAHSDSLTLDQFSFMQHNSGSANDMKSSSFSSTNSLYSPTLATKKPETASEVNTADLRRPSSTANLRDSKEIAADGTAETGNDNLGKQKQEPNTKRQSELDINNQNVESSVKKGPPNIENTLKLSAIPLAYSQHNNNNNSGAHSENATGNNATANGGGRNTPRNSNNEELAYHRSRNNRAENKSGFRNWTNRRNNGSNNSSHNSGKHNYNNQRYESKSREETAPSSASAATKKVKDEKLSAANGRNHWNGQAKGNASNVSNTNNSTAAQTDTATVAAVKAAVNNSKPPNLVAAVLPTTNQNTPATDPPSKEATESTAQLEENLPTSIATDSTANLLAAPVNDSSAATRLDHNVNAPTSSERPHVHYPLHILHNLGEQMHVGSETPKATTNVINPPDNSPDALYRNALNYSASNMLTGGDNRHRLGGLCNGSLGPNTLALHQQQYQNIPPYPYPNQNSHNHYHAPANALFSNFNRRMVESMNEDAGNRRGMDYGGGGAINAGNPNYQHYRNYYTQQQHQTYSPMMHQFNEHMNGMMAGDAINRFPSAGNMNNHGQRAFRHYNHNNNNNRNGGNIFHQGTRNYSNSNYMNPHPNNNRNQQQNAQISGAHSNNDLEPQQRNKKPNNSNTLANGGALGEQVVGGAMAKNMPKPNLAISDRKPKTSYNATACNNSNRVNSRNSYHNDYGRRNSHSNLSQGDRQPDENFRSGGGMQDNFSYARGRDFANTSNEYRHSATTQPLNSRQNCMPMPINMPLQAMAQPQQLWQQQLPPTVVRCSALDEAATANAAAEAASASASASAIADNTARYSHVVANGYESDVSSTHSHKEQRSQPQRRNNSKTLNESHSSNSSVSLPSMHSLSGLSENALQQQLLKSPVEHETIQHNHFPAQFSEQYSNQSISYNSQRSYNTASNLSLTSKPSATKVRVITGEDIINMCRQGLLPSQQMLEVAFNELVGMDPSYRRNHWTAQIGTISNLRQSYDEKQQPILDGLRHPCYFCNTVHKETCSDYCRRERCLRHQTLSELLLMITPADRYLDRSPLVELKTPPANWLEYAKWDALSQALWEKFLNVQQTEQRYKEKMSLWRYLFVILRNCCPRFGLYLVGSTISGFGSNTSDVDMCVVTRNSSIGDSRFEAVACLKCLRQTLGGNTQDFDEFQLIEAKVPILRFRNRSNHLEVDLNFNNCVGIKNTYLLHCYAECDWRVRPLALVVKQWAQYHAINNAKDMTISSYSLVLMVINFLQILEPNVLPCLHRMHPERFQLLRYNDFGTFEMSVSIDFESKNTSTLGELFLQFLKHYTEFDYINQAISVRTGSTLPVHVCREARSLKNDPHQWNELCIEEPFDLTNTARSVYDYETFKYVKAVFSASYNVLNETHDLDSVFTALKNVPMRAKNESRAPSPRDGDIRHSDKHINHHWRNNNNTMMFSDQWKSLKDGQKTDTDTSSSTDTNSMATESASSSKTSQLGETIAVGNCSENFEILSPRNGLLNLREQHLDMQGIQKEEDVTTQTGNNIAGDIQVESGNTAAETPDKEYAAAKEEDAQVTEVVPKQEFKEMAEHVSAVCSSEDNSACLQTNILRTDPKTDAAKTCDLNANILTESAEHDALAESESVNGLQNTTT